jgi:PTH1 family peptidyl-tRNA hydrolase
MIARRPSDGVRLIIGLGNPGEEYKNTYHNTGALFADYFAAALGTPIFKKAGSFEYKKTQDLIIAKALVYMNDSGAAVSKAIKYFKIKPGNTLIAHDDSDITLGDFKLSFGRKSAGHHGIESVIKSIKTTDFYRLRIGVRPPNEVKRKKAGDFVLKSISAANRKVLEKTFDEATREISQLI